MFAVIRTTQNTINAVAVFTDRIQAEMHLRTVGEEGNVPVNRLISEPLDLTVYSAVQLVALYNHLYPAAPVKEFNTKQVASDRIWTLLSALPPTVITEENNVTDTASVETTTTKPKKTRGAPKAAKAPKAKAGRVAKFADDSKIEMLVKENPKREGSGSYQRFAHYRNGMLVKTALDKGVTRGDIIWDVEHKFIRIIPKGGVPAAETTETAGE